MGEWVSVSLDGCSDDAGEDYLDDEEYNINIFILYNFFNVLNNVITHAVTPWTTP